MKLEETCCEKYLSKAKACKRCPLFAALCKAERKKLLARTRKKLKKSGTKAA